MLKRGQTWDMAFGVGRVQSENGGENAVLWDGLWWGFAYAEQALKNLDDD